jgi:flagellin
MVALTLNTNLSSLNAQRHLDSVQAELGDAIDRISSGVRIQGAKDGSAELTLTENIRADILVLEQGAKNLDDGTAFVNISEGALSAISAILLRLRSLAAQSANGTISDVERASTNIEYASSLHELDRIVDTTEYNGAKLIDGSLAKGVDAAQHKILQLGVDTTEDHQLNLNNILDIKDQSTKSLGLTGSNIKTQGAALTALNDLTVAINQIINTRARVGTAQIRMLHAADNLDITQETLTSAVSTVRDADLAEELTILTKNQLLVQAGVAMIGQANLNPQAALTLLEGV